MEEEPEPIIVPAEPDEEPEEPAEEPAASAATATIVPRVDAPIERTIADKLSEASHDEWHLVDIIDAGDKKALLLRKRKQKEAARRPVGFAR